MPSTITDIAQATQDNVLGAFETSKTYTVESLKAVTGTARRVLPSLPSMPELTPMIDPMEAVTMTYDFAEKLLAAQRSFVEEVVATLAPSN
jgi:hypothetical protein